MQPLTPPTVKAMLADGGEIALIDVREEGVFAQGHLLLARSALRVSLGWSSTQDDVDRFLEALSHVVARARASAGERRGVTAPTSG